MDFLAHLLRKVGRHLTAFDLVRFHHRGANYPDALLLDEVWARLTRRIEKSPALVLRDGGDDESACRRKRLLRRGLCQAWLIRRQYRGYRVPDAPTSPGENARVLPAPFARVPDEQIENLAARTKRLFLDESDASCLPALVADALRQSVADLRHPAERLELGLGLFLDRPFGFAKSPGEPDGTTLLSHEAYSERIASTRLNLLREIGLVDDAAPFDRPTGIACGRRSERQRPGVVAASDALLASDDFVYLRTTRRAIRDLLVAYDFSPLQESGLYDALFGDRCLIVPSSESDGELCMYDAASRLRLVLRLDPSRGYACRAGVESLAAGLSTMEAWDASGSPMPGGCNLHLPQK